VSEHTFEDPVQFLVISELYREARRAYGYVPADERPERIAEELADEE
jgi:hypothetical protein